MNAHGLARLPPDARPGAEVIGGRDRELAAIPEGGVVAGVVGPDWTVARSKRATQGQRKR